ncbi:glutamate decarboxylase [Basidiobolus meristosporus CBS 931.73]|uniref:Glutamate decarboxylase n=1 Tax=Basidiobolus meristosporus CBS 931.73 TaxID=1314790 RepID=A0A1Y1YT69_9FUNG|nr:glutamate decarboxylase [Basidiobolus meristosporus CBS 931.73]|eukprot:ORY01232.1 glutamate decarboxylase [Basidiobolus meristosporus CBS 931.73]
MVFLAHAVSDARLAKSDDPSSSIHDDSVVSTTVYGSHWAAQDIPRFSMPDEEMPPKVAYKLIKDELALDGNPVLNLASFVTTYMEEEAEKLMAENLSKNFIDYEEYPLTCEIQNRCVNMIARLFNAPMDDSSSEALGCSTIGSSEAIILACLAMKRRWQEKRKAAGKDATQPNIVMGANVQVCWEKAVKYLEIEPRYVYCTENCFVLTPQEAVDLVDENTIGVAAILGSTYTGHYEDVQTLNNLLEKKNKEEGLDVQIHVDAASGGFVAPFVRPELVWDFRLPLVASINASGHKYGLCYPGIGWCVWRSPEYLPKDLIFNINYLGADQASFTLNFSKGASNVIAQYYIFIRLGKSGFRSIMNNLTQTADFLAENLKATGYFDILSEGNGYGLPLVAFKLSKKSKFDEFDIVAKLRERGWIIPAYTMAPHAEKVKLCRVVIREDFSRSRCELLIKDLMSTIHMLEKMDSKTIEEHKSAHHRHHHRLRNVSRVTFHKKHGAQGNQLPSKTSGVC